MQKGDMGIPRCASIDSPTERMVFRNTEVIRSSFIHEDEGTGGNSVPGIRRNHIESGLQLCFEWPRVFGMLAVLDVDTRDRILREGFTHKFLPFRQRESSARDKG